MFKYTFKNRFIFIGFAGFVTAILYFFGVQTVYAGTTVPFQVMSGDVVWEKSGNPYRILSDVIVPSGSSLTIKDGVEITSSSTSSRIVVNGGKLFMKGKGTSRISIKSLANIDVLDGYAEIINTDVVGGIGLSFTNSRARIATSTISSTVTAIRSKESVVSVEGSRLVNNGTGINVQPKQVILIMSNSSSETGGIGNALDGTIPVAAPAFSINNSVIKGNTSALRNFSTYTVDAKDNWWGTTSPPLTTGANRISGSINFTPWLMSEPALDPGKEEPDCCSSILFLPGLQATRLYNDTEKLWEPMNNGDVEALFLNEQGSSTDPTIYAGDPISKAYGMKGIYNSFLNLLDSLKNENTISEWKVFGYDWRMPITEVVAGQTKRATTTESLIHAVEDLASRSKTGKITLIAHSNGGLVGKYLVKVLTDLGKESLIDSFISVAVPHLGTPMAVAGLMHGDEQSIAWGSILSKSTARELGENMASAYSLLPSATYFQKVFSPTIAFASTSLGNDITTYNDQHTFLLSSTSPSKANSFLLAAAEALHNILDPFIWPSTITRWGIVGWNALTTKSVEYSNKKECSWFRCKLGITHSLLKTELGDGTVISPSATFEVGTTASIDLTHSSNEDGKTIRHGNIFEASTTKAIIKKIVSEHPNEPFSLPSGAHWGEPPYKSFNSLVVSTHSPVELHVYDSLGNHTGIIPGTIPGVDESLFTSFEEKIPGSTFETLAGDDGDNSESYVYLNNSSSETYSVVMKGTDIGSATLRFERVEDDKKVETVEFVIPVSQLTEASTTISIGNLNNAVQVDADGNGSVDASVQAGAEFDPILSIELIRKTVATLLGDTTRAKELDKRLEHIEDMIIKGKEPQVKHLSQKLDNKIGHVKFGELTAQDKELIIRQIEYMIAETE